MRCNPLITVGVLACLSLPALADEDFFSLSLEELGKVRVSIATGTPKSLASVPAGASVVTADDIAILGAQTLDEVLETLPGVHVSRGSFQYAPRYFIRGISSTYNPHTLMLVNGVPMTSLFVGDRGERIPNQHSIPVKAIERIEVIRGPGSALYGADAFAGVINVITKSADDIEETRVTTSWGSFDTGRANVIGAHRFGDVAVATSLSATRTNGDDSMVIRSDQQSDLDALFGTSASLAPGVAATSATFYDARVDVAWRDFRWRASWMRAHDTGTGQGINDALDPDSRFSHARGVTDLSWSNSELLDDWTLDADISYVYGEFTNPTGINLFPAGADFGLGAFPDGVQGKPELREETVRAQFGATLERWDTHRIRFGTGYHWADLFETSDTNNTYINVGGALVPRPGPTDITGTAAVFQPEASRYSSYVFVQDEWQLAPRWELTTGVRYDNYSDVGDTVNPRLALVWTSTDTLTTKLLYGEAFRAPAFFELYATDNPVALGNPSLAPESLRSGELGFDWRPDNRWLATLNLYHWRINDYIDFVADPGQATVTAQNAGEIRGYGAETEVRQQISERLQWLANYSYQHTRDVRTEEPLGFVPTHQVYARLSWSFASRWQLTPQVSWVGERRRAAGDLRDDLEGYTSVDLALRKGWRDGLEVALIGRNLFDADIREPSRGPGPGQAGPAIEDDLPQQGRFIALELSAPW
jgi:iron complex outermembrane receptor protein